MADKNILLVHGAWHGKWCWDYFTPELALRGWRVSTLDLPSSSGEPGLDLQDDADAVLPVPESANDLLYQDVSPSLSRPVELAALIDEVDATLTV